MTSLLNKSPLELFRQEFWKDKRQIEVLADNTLIKHYDSSLEQDVEVSVMKFLRKNGIKNIPDIIEVKDLSTRMTYYKGIRVFNFLAILDKLDSLYPDRVNPIKSNIIMRCLNQQKTIQRLLVKWNENSNMMLQPYPMIKLVGVIDLLSQCLKIDYKKAELNNELVCLYEAWKINADIPFRDATTKNMIINHPALALSEFKNEFEREEFIRKIIKTSTVDEYLKCPIIDIDFSSCLNLTTKEDDFISLCFHERTWDGFLPHINKFRVEGMEDLQQIALSFIVRFLRFGGRKAAYKILHNDTYKVRFKYDDPCYYFDNMPRFIASIKSDVINEYPELFKIIKIISEKLRNIYISKDYFKEIECELNELVYEDVFPF